MSESERNRERAPEPAATNEEMRDRFLGWLPKDCTLAEQQEILLREIQKAGGALFAQTPERTAAFTALLEKLANTQYENTDAMINSMASETTAVVNDYFTKEGLANEQRQIRREAAEAAGQVWLNDAISYGTDDRLVHVHIADLRHLPALRQAAQTRDGLRALAAVIAANPTIELITATSPLVADPRTAEGIEAVGFRIIGPISDEERAMYFPDDKRPISKAIMTREEFLAKWGKKTPAK